VTYPRGTSGVDPTSPLVPIIRSTAINLAGLLAPLLVAVVAIPISLRGLGVERFGIMSLILVLLGYFTLFDLGIGRATTKRVAEALAARRHDKVGSLLATSLSLNLALGLCAAVVIAVVSALVIERLPFVSEGLRQETGTSFLVLSASAPALLAISALRGALEAALRFDLVNLMLGPSNALLYAIPAVGALAGWPLPTIVAVLVFSRVITAGVLARAVFSVFHVRLNARSWRDDAKSLVGFGRWLTLTAAVGPVIVYGDRFLIAGIIGVAQLAYYAAPFDALSRLSVIPGALVTTLFPVISRAVIYSEAQLIYARSLKYLVIALTALVMLVVIFADGLIAAWLGPSFVPVCGPLLRILSVGFFLNSLAYLPLTLLQARGRADVPAKLHLIELVPALALAAALIEFSGLQGGAMAWTVRAAVDAVLLFRLSQIVDSAAWASFRREGVAKSALFGFLALALGLAAQFAPADPPARAFVGFAILILFATGTIVFLLDALDFDLVRRIVKAVTP
jgi:O-antigen/teichoic acid export membrane protein